MARRRSLAAELDVDERTNEMSEAALICRASGHVWVRRAMTRRRHRQLMEQGLWEWDRYCDNECGSSWRQVFNYRTGELIENERVYPTGGTYLLPKNTGRLRRENARVAWFARQLSAA